MNDGFVCAAAGRQVTKGKQQKFETKILNLQCNFKL